MEDRVKLTLNLPMVKLELTGDPKKHISELRKLFAELRQLSSVAIDAELLEEALPSLTLPFWKLSKDVQKNEATMSMLNKLSQLEEGIALRKMTAENISELTDQGSVSKVNVQSVKTNVHGMLHDIDVEKVNTVFVHVAGDVDKEGFDIILDQVAKHLPHARFEKLQTQKDMMGKTLVECVLFGNLPSEEEGY